MKRNERTTDFLCFGLLLPLLFCPTAFFHVFSSYSTYNFKSFALEVVTESPRINPFTYRITQPHVAISPNKNQWIRDMCCSTLGQWVASTHNSVWPNGQLLNEASEQ